VYFSSDRQGPVQFWKVAAEGGPPSKIGTGIAPETGPLPSPDGRWIAFESETGWIWLMRSDGSGAHPVADWHSTYSGATAADWSPVGSRLAVQLRRPDGAGRLGTANIDPASGTVSGLREIDAPGSNDGHPRWSPDGRALACETVLGAWTVWIIDPGSGRATQLPGQRGNRRSPTWQADPLHLYFVMDQNSVWRFPMADASTPTGPATLWLAVPHLKLAPDSLDISRDGKRLIAAISTPETRLWMIEPR
jgi:Tol biopolymer transport system component